MKKRFSQCLHVSVNPLSFPGERSVRKVFSFGKSFVLQSLTFSFRIHSIKYISLKLFYPNWEQYWKEKENQSPVSFSESCSLSAPLTAPMASGTETDTTPKVLLLKETSSLSYSLSLSLDFLLSLLRTNTEREKKELVKNRKEL